MPKLAMSVVIGDLDIVRALGLAGLPSAYFGPLEYSARFYRHVPHRPALGRFQALAEIHALPVPPAQRLRPGADGPRPRSTSRSRSL